MSRNHANPLVEFFALSRQPPKEREKSGGHFPEFHFSSRAIRNCIFFLTPRVRSEAEAEAEHPAPGDVRKIGALYHP